MDLFLDEYPQWEAASLQCPVILQGMFAHAKTTGQKEIKWAICHNCQQSYPGLNVKAEVPTKTTRDEIRELYNDVYQLKRSPGPVNLHLFKRATVAKAGFCPAKGRTRMGSYKHLEAQASSRVPSKDASWGQ